MIYFEAYAVLSLAKIVAIYVFCVYKIFLPKKNSGIKFLRNFKPGGNHSRNQKTFRICTAVLENENSLLVPLRFLPLCC